MRFPHGRILAAVFSSLVALTLSPPSPASTLDLDFCRDPYPAVCGQPAANPTKDRIVLLANAISGLKTKYRIEGKLAFTVEPSKRGAEAIPHLEGLAPGRRAEFFHDLQRDVTARVLAGTGARHRELIRGRFHAIFAGMRHVIRNHSELTASDVALLLRHLEGIELLLPEAVLTGSIPEGLIYDTFDSSCGWDGLGASAFLSTVTREVAPGVRASWNWLVPCPGLYLDVIRSSSGSDDRGALGPHSRLTARIAFTLAHEMGHAIDPSSMPGTYGALGGCLARHYGPGSQGELLDEAVADFWGTELLSTMLPAIPTEERSELLRQSLFPLCGNESQASSDTGHTGPRARVEMVLRNPLIRQAMGCTATPAKPYCSISGAVY